MNFMEIKSGSAADAAESLSAATDVAASAARFSPVPPPPPSPSGASFKDDEVEDVDVGGAGTEAAELPAGGGVESSHDDDLRLLSTSVA